MAAKEKAVSRKENVKADVVAPKEVVGTLYIYLLKTDCARFLLHLFRRRTFY
jgi:hypothetical protein